MKYLLPILIVVIAVIVLIAYFIKRKKKSGKEEIVHKVAEEYKPETVEKPVLEVPQPKVEEIQPKKEKVFEKDEVFDFSAYAREKVKSITRPQRKEMPNASNGDFEPYVPIRDDGAKSFRKKKLTLKEEFEAMSPEMKAFILSGALDKRYID